MPNTKISNLTTAATLTGTEVAPIVQSSSTVKVTTQNIANLALPSQTGNANRYLQTNGTTASWDAVNISTADITGTLPIASGGTGQTTANTAINALLPSQISQSGKFLTTDGINTSWATAGGGAGFTYASYRYTFAASFITATELVNNIGFVNTITAASPYIQIDSSGTPFTNNKTFVTATGFATTSVDIAIVGGIEYVSTSRIRIHFYTNAGVPYSFSSKTSSYNGTINIQIYP